ncbi:ATP-grasp domain-containing protein [Luteolibacter luteus]|uniref:ATP-grasp domain-containing protein n=1 Tax=Luteolibacter luteus TaxID=2728835 RepID=A0A858RDZ1_9BACT|nr:ATP-grasp domain-containing protein [Luteolibacter luteus]QJE95306.1 ATP-grasp domain-containing protein [Luteolibacter luteus]
MNLLFPCEPFSPRRVEPDFVSEYEAARLAGFPCTLYSHEDLEAGDIVKALKMLPEPGEDRRILMRGWMAPGERYRLLHAGLSDRGYQPLTSPDGYDEAHYLPLAYPITAGLTARSQWIEGDNEDDAWQLYQGFRGADAIIKDWVKSAKSRWKDACYIPAGTSRERFGEMFRIFRQERGKLFNRGVVLREFLPFMERGRDILGLPMVEETRLFFWQGECLVPADRNSPGPMDEIGRWTTIARQFLSPFVTVDVALLEDGSWKIVETGDGQVSGLPLGLDPERFYMALWNKSY